MNKASIKVYLNNKPKNGVLRQIIVTSLTGSILLILYETQTV